MKISFALINKKYYFIALGLATLAYFTFIRLFQDWLYHWMGIDVRPVELFESFGPTFMVAEPIEAPLYLFAYLAVPVLALLFMPLVQALIPRIKSKHALIAGLLAAILAAIVFFTKYDLNFLFQTIENKGIGKIAWLLFTKRLYLANLLLALSALSAVVFYFWKRPGIDLYFRESMENFFRRFWPLGLIILAILVFNPSFPVDTHHFNYYLGAVNDVYQGKGILYESSHLYGLFDVYFLALLFKVIPMTYPMMALIVAASYFLFFVGIFIFVKKWIKSYTLATIATASLVSIIYFFQTSLTRSVLFFPGMSPFRWGLYVPALLSVLAYSQTKKTKYVHAALLISAVAVFWNFDTGLFLTVAALITFGHFHLSQNWNWRGTTKVVGIYLIYLISLFVAINLINHAVYGSWPDWSLFLKEIKYFAQGAGMYPLPAVGIYQALFLTYLIVLLTALYRLINRGVIDSSLLFLASFGACWLVYYIGESTWQLLYVVTIPFILIVFYGFNYFRKYAFNPEYERLVSAGMASFLVFAVLLLAFKLPLEFKARNYAQARENLLAVRADEQDTYADAKILERKYSQKRIPVVSTNDTKLLVYSGKANYFDFYYYFTVYYRSEVRRYINQVISGKPKLLIIGKNQQRNDQVDYFMAGISDLYEPVEFLKTVDIYELK